MFTLKRLEEGLLSVVLLETTKEITDYACGVNTFLHHMHSFYSRICMSCVPSRPPGLPQRGPGETAKTCIANYFNTPVCHTIRPWNFQVCRPSLKGEKRFHQSSSMKSWVTPGTLFTNSFLPRIQQITF